ncbi:MAG: hypothetical protein ACQSGP_14385 [Frankia sp.]
MPAGGSSVESSVDAGCVAVVRQARDDAKPRSRATVRGRAVVCRPWSYSAAMPAGAASSTTAEQHAAIISPHIALCQPRTDSARRYRLVSVATAPHSCASGQAVLAAAERLPVRERDQPAAAGEEQQTETRERGGHDPPPTDGGMRVPAGQPRQHTEPAHQPTARATEDEHAGQQQHQIGEQPRDETEERAQRDPAVRQQVAAVVAEMLPLRGTGRLGGHPASDRAADERV